MKKLNLNEIEENARYRKAYSQTARDCLAVINKVRELAGCVNNFLTAITLEEENDAIVHGGRVLESIKGLESPDSAPNKTKES